MDMASTPNRTFRSRLGGATANPDPYAEARARLTREFTGMLSARGVEIVLDGCIADLSGVPRSEKLEESERLARQRITSYCRSRDRGFAGRWLN